MKIEYKKLENEEYVNQCDFLLTKLIQSEKIWNDNINEYFLVKDYFINIYKNKNNIIYFAQDQEKVIGYVYAKINWDNSSKEREALLDSIYVLPEYRNNDVGKNLIGLIEKELKSKNIKYLNLNVIKDNIGARNFYKQLKFQEYGIILRKNI